MSMSDDKTGKTIRIIMITVSTLFVAVMLVMPLLMVIVNSLRKGISFYLSAITTTNVISAVKVTLTATVITLLVNTIFGITASVLLTRFTFRGKNVLQTLIDIPFSTSPVIAGLSFIMIFGRMGWAAPAINAINDTLGLNIRIVFALPGVVLATIFVTFPFVSREIIPVLNAVGSDEEEAASLMGADFFTIFRRITFPHMKWALISFDKWMRNRVRMCIWKQWKTPHNRFKCLRKLGVSYDRAYRTAYSRKGCARCVNNPIVSFALRNEILKLKGLLFATDHFNLVHNF